MIGRQQRAVFDMLYDYKRQHDHTPPIRTIASHARLSLSQTEAALASLARNGYIRRMGVNGRTRPVIEIVSIPAAGVDYIPDWVESADAGQGAA